MGTLRERRGARRVAVSKYSAEFKNVMISKMIAEGGRSATYLGKEKNIA